MRFCFHHDEGHDAGDGILLGGKVCAHMCTKKKIKKENIDMAKLEVTQWQQKPIPCCCRQFKAFSGTLLLSAAVLQFSAYFYQAIPVQFWTSVLWLSPPESSLFSM